MKIWQWLSMFLVLIIAAVGFWFIGRQGGKIVEVIKEIERDNPNMSKPVAQTEGAKKVSTQVLTTTQQLENTYLLSYLSSNLKSAESSLAELQENAIINPSTITNEAVAEAEKDAQQARAELESQWKSAADKAEQNVLEAGIASQVAVSATIKLYDQLISGSNLIQTASNSVNQLQNQIDSFRVTTIMGATFYTNGNTTITSKTYQGMVANLTNAKQNLANMQATQQKRMLDYTVARSNSDTCLNNYNFVIERALTIAADLRLLGLILAVANRLDSVARAARTKSLTLDNQLNNLENKISTLSEQFDGMA